MRPEKINLEYKRQLSPYRQRRPHPITQQLLDDIEAYCLKADISPSRFGQQCVNDSHFVWQLKSGRQPRFATIDRVRHWIEKRTKAVA